MDEYISREEAKQFFNLNFGSVSHAIIAARLLDEIPAADVAPVRNGRWKIIGQVCIDGEYEDTLRCTNCGMKHDRKSRYCENCGARMDGDV